MFDEASLADFGEFWQLSEREFLNVARERYGSVHSKDMKALVECYEAALAAVNKHWHQILSSENRVEGLIKQAYAVTDEFYDEITKSVSSPSLSWALRAIR